MASSPALSTASGGLLETASGSQASSYFTGGLSSTALPAAPSLNPMEIPPLLQAPLPQTPFPLTDQAAQYITAPIFDAAGKPLYGTPATAPINVGSGATLSFDPTTSRASMSPAVKLTSPISLAAVEADGVNANYTGADIRMLIEIADPLGPKRWAKQFFECTTITISIHRVKDPARACGYIGAKGYSRGGRTIAGTIVLTEMAKDALFEFFSAAALRDKSKDSFYPKLDQLPPFNITLLFGNEEGFVSSRKLLGIEPVTDGTVYSINDAFTERTMSYVAADMTPLMPLTIQQLQAPTALEDQSTTREMSPRDVMRVPTPKTDTSSGFSFR